MVQVKPELVPDGPVQPLQLVEGGHCGRLRLYPQLGSSGVPRQQVEQHEHDQRDEKQHDEGLQKTPEDIARQLEAFASRPKRARDRALGRGYLRGLATGERFTLWNFYLVKAQKLGSI
jgi:hypothetical protein